MRNAAAKQGSREIPEPESPEPDLDRAGKKAALVGGSGEEGCKARELRCLTLFAMCVADNQAPRTCNAG
jgi:hypothetical protein